MAASDDLEANRIGPGRTGLVNGSIDLVHIECETATVCAYAAAVAVVLSEANRFRVDLRQPRPRRLGASVDL